MKRSDAETRDRVRDAVARLQEVLTALAFDVTARVDERCPYRARDDRCTFAGGCRNQRGDRGASPQVLRCAGDHLLRREGP